MKVVRLKQRHTNTKDDKTNGPNCEGPQLATASDLSPATDQFEVSVGFQFEAAHYLTEVPDNRPQYGTLHGHSFVGTATFSGKRHPVYGWVADVETLRAVVEEVHESFDHCLLNDRHNLKQPTLENLSIIIGSMIHFKLGRFYTNGDGPRLKSIELARPSIGERCKWKLEAF